MGGRPGWVKKRTHQRNVELEKKVSKAKSSFSSISATEPLQDPQAVLDKVGKILEQRKEIEESRLREEKEKETREKRLEENRLRHEYLAEQEKRQRKAQFAERDRILLERYYNGDDEALYRLCVVKRSTLEHLRNNNSLLYMLNCNSFSSDDVFSSFVQWFTKKFDRKLAFESFGIDPRSVFTTMANFYRWTINRFLNHVHSKRYMAPTRCIQLDKPISEGEGDTLQEFLKDNRNWYNEMMHESEKDELCRYVRKVVNDLPVDRRKMCLLVMRGVTQSECANLFGLTRQAVNMALHSLATKFNREKLCRLGFRVSKVLYAELELKGKIKTALLCGNLDLADKYRDRLSRLYEYESEEIKDRSRNMKNVQLGRVDKRYRDYRMNVHIIEANAKRDVDDLKYRIAETRQDLLEVENETNLMQENLQEEVSEEVPEEKDVSAEVEVNVYDSAPDVEDEQYDYYHGDDDISNANRDANYLALSGC